MYKTLYGAAYKRACHVQGDIVSALLTLNRLSSMYEAEDERDHDLVHE